MARKTPSAWAGSGPERRAAAVDQSGANDVASPLAPPRQGAVPHEVRAWMRWAEPWYLAYGLLGATVAGLLPILLPVTVALGQGAGEVGLVMAMLSLGGLTAPLWGRLADRHRLHRWLLAGGLCSTAVGVLAFASVARPTVRLGLAFLQGAGAAAAGTVANLFVVEAHPKAEWDERIGWLQTFYGGGQVGGLVLAGFLSQGHPRLGLLVAGGLPALALVPGWFSTRTPARLLSARPILLHPARHGEWAVCSPQRLFHYLSWETLTRLRSCLRSSFGLFLGAWLLSFGGSTALFSLYPVLMEQVFGVRPGLSSWAFAAAAGLGLVLYPRAGRWSDRFGPSRVLRFALAVRVLGFLGLLVLGLTRGMWSGYPALLVFLFVVLAWSLLSVSGTALTAELSPVGEGEGMGVFNATTAMAGVFGSAVGGWTAGAWGYLSALGLGAAGTAIGLAIAVAIRPVHPKEMDPLQRSKRQ